MDTYSSGEDLVVKTRKPYTITKQRERWTEDEHNKFLEALKLHGRAWQRIEEHIGTKTAVQIRSHAQKFFSKLEKEALVKGVPIRQTIEIDIPPPRPKRKPSNPYPRKTDADVPGCQKPAEDEKHANPTENKDGDCSETISLTQEAQCSSVYLENKRPASSSVTRINSCSFMEVVALKKKGESCDGRDDSCFFLEINENQKMDKSDGKKAVMGNGNDQVLRENTLPNTVEKSDNEMQVTHNYPRHVPVHVIDGNTGTSTQSTLPDKSFLGSVFHPREEDCKKENLYSNPSAFSEQLSSSTGSSVHQSFPTFHHPFTTPCFHDQADYQSFLQASSTFWSLIVSTLLQNPAAHAAASFSATFWPFTNMETPPCTQESLPSRQMTSAPSMAAIASATIAAATAWWSAHGMLPLCRPVHSGFTCAPKSTDAVPLVDSDQVTVTKQENEEHTGREIHMKYQSREPEYAEASQVQSYSKGDGGAAKPNTESKASDHEKTAAVDELHEENKAKGIKQIDRSSCGSNTASSSEVETDVLEKQEKGKEEEKDAKANDQASESLNLCFRSANNLNDSWKEVSEGGRLAFQALFSRDRLPQSFSPPHGLKNEEQQKNTTEEQKQKTDEKDVGAMLLDLNSNVCFSCSGHQSREEDVPSRAENYGEKGLHPMGLRPGKIKFRRTGFKPYKRCSVEATENAPSSRGEEKGPKRIRLEDESST